MMTYKIFTSIIVFLITVSTFSQEKHTKSNNDLNARYKTLEKEKKQLRNQIDGSILKELNFEDINGNKHTLESLQGKVVVLNFWFIQCKPCIKEFPDLNELTTKFKKDSVSFFAVTWNDKSSLHKFLETHQLEYTVVPDGKLIKKFQIPHYPFHIIIDQQGKVEYINEVLSFNVIKKIERKINKLL